MKEQRRVRSFRMSDEEFRTVQALLREIKEKTRRPASVALISALRLYNNMIDGNIGNMPENK